MFAQTIRKTDCINEVDFELCFELNGTALRKCINFNFVKFGNLVELKFC